MTTSSPTVDLTGSIEEPEWTISDARKWMTLGLLCTGVLLSFVARTNISAALAYKPFVRAFALSDIGRGTLNSAFFWSYAAFQIPTGWIVDRYGIKVPYAISFVLWCLASAAIGFTHSLSQLTTMRVATGAGEAIVMPASYRWMRNNFKEEQAGLAVGNYMLGTKFGPAIGAPIGMADCQIRLEAHVHHHRSWRPAVAYPVVPDHEVRQAYTG